MVKEHFVVQFGRQSYSWLNRMIIYRANWTTRQLLLWWQTELDSTQFYYHSLEHKIAEPREARGEAHKMSGMGGGEKWSKLCNSELGRAGFNTGSNIGMWDILDLLLVGVNLNPVLWF